MSATVHFWRSVNTVYEYKEGVWTQSAKSKNEMLIQTLMCKSVITSETDIYIDIFKADFLLYFKMFVECKANAIVKLHFFLRVDQIDKFHNLTNTFLY